MFDKYNFFEETNEYSNLCLFPFIICICSFYFQGSLLQSPFVTYRYSRFVKLANTLSGKILILFEPIFLFKKNDNNNNDSNKNNMPNSGVTF